MKVTPTKKQSQININSSFFNLWLCLKLYDVVF